MKKIEVNLILLIATEPKMLEKTDMQLNDKQRSYLRIAIIFVVWSIVFEVGYYFVKGQLSLHGTPFIVAGAIIAGIIGIIANKTK
ncbi:MAG: hypothetical protein U9N81_04200 [Bacillota bacterium]|nr:hypothetical protein [Bacillota bacterium]